MRMQEQDTMEAIMRLRVWFHPLQFVELFVLWLDFECFACKACIVFGTGQYFMHLVGVLGENGTYGDKDYLQIHQF